MRAAVIPTHNRHADLVDCVRSVADQVDEILIIDNASDPKIDATWLARLAGVNGDTNCDVRVFWDSEQPPNLSKMWAQGIDYFRYKYKVWNLGVEPAWIAVLNDDAVVPMGWFDAVQEAMEATGAVLGWSDPFGRVATGSRKFRQTSPGSVYDRVCGWAFVLRYPGAPMPDINLRWYYGDSQLDYQAARSGGCVAVGGYPVINKHPGASTVGELARQSGLDRAYFIANYEEPAW